MSWFGNDPAAELDVKIEEATSESIPNGEMDMAVAMEITDVIRSKKVPPKQAMRGLKKRLTKVYANPNTLAAVLKLADVCVKNGGSHFLAEINSKEFIDYLVDYIFKVHYDVKNYMVYSSEAKHAIGIQILKLVKEWSMYLPGNTPGNFLARAYTNLNNQGYEFPEVDESLLANASNFVDSATPPDWIDGHECMICYNPFSVMTRKHHCRACGGVFCQAHSSKSLPLVALGILEPVRVCDNCYEIYKPASERDNAASGQGGVTNASRNTNTTAVSGNDEDEQLKRAIELSLQETGVPASFGDAERPSMPPPGHVASATQDGAGEESDEEMKAAIAASLAEFQQKNRPVESIPVSQAPAPEPASDFYSNIMPFNAGAYSSQAQTQTRPQPQNQVVAHQQQPIQEQLTAKRRVVEDLSSQEEEDINLFVQLMSGIKSDPAKQANIVYDQKLGELHGRVVRLKPKLNRALRMSIEKYEFFLEMNNKINSITRLYDQFLDHKLNQAYHKPQISSPGATYASPSHPPPANYGSQFFVQRNNVYDPPHLASPQSTGPQSLAYQSTATHQLPPQQTGNQGSVEYPVPGPLLHGYPQTTGDQGFSPQKSGYSAEQPPSQLQQQQQPQQQQPQKQNTGSRNSGLPATSPQASVQPIKRRESQAPYPAELAFENVDNYKNNPIPSYPQVPSSPPLDGLSDEESDVESVTSRYPALEDKYSAEDLPDSGTKEHASTRFPSLNDLGLPALESEPHAGLKKQSTSDSKKFRAEPEPLIEL